MILKIALTLDLNETKSEGDKNENRRLTRDNGA